MFSSMLNTALERNHEEMVELHFKHEVMEYQFVRNKHLIPSAQALMAKFKLIMGCEDLNYRISLAEPESSHGYHNYGRQQDYMHQGASEIMSAKTNFFGETIEVPAGHTYQTKEELKEAKSNLRRWATEWLEKKTVEMENFCGRREQNFNESETASSLSGTRISNKPEKAERLAQDA